MLRRSRAGGNGSLPADPEDPGDLERRAADLQSLAEHTELMNKAYNARPCHCNNIAWFLVIIDAS